MSMDDIKFLESIDNIKLLAKKKLGSTLNTSKSQEISSCLIQGRLFFQAAKSGATEIKPLQLYYGIMAFAKAIILFRTKSQLCTLTQSHGLSANFDRNITVSQIEIGNAGTFVAFNDVISQLDELRYYIGDTLQVKKIRPHYQAQLQVKKLV